MGRKRRDMACLRPFCFYCEKSFKNEVILHHHQKAKHFSCPKCPKKFSSIDSMIQHARSQHNQNIERVPSAINGRDSVALKIFGMQGVPRIEIQSWISRSVNRYWGKIMDKKIQERKRREIQLGKERREEERKDEAMIQEKPENQELDFPLEFSFK